MGRNDSKGSGHLPVCTEDGWPLGRTALGNGGPCGHLPVCLERTGGHWVGLHWGVGPVDIFPCAQRTGGRWVGLYWGMGGRVDIFLCV